MRLPVNHQQHVDNREIWKMQELLENQIDLFTVMINYKLLDSFKSGNNLNLLVNDEIHHAKTTLIYQ